MSWWLLLLFVTVVWLLFAVFDGLYHRCAILSGWVIFGWILWALAMLVDLFVPPWGTNIVVGLHAFVAVCLLGGIVEIVRRRRQ